MKEHISKTEWSKWREKLTRAGSTFRDSQSHSREVSLLFGEFCNVSGRVLDVGSGPSIAPYLESAKCSLCIGLDPLPMKEPGFDLVRGVGEFLPFADGAFDHCIGGTSLDHCVRPRMVLEEMRRVTKYDGNVCLWVGLHDFIRHAQRRQKIGFLPSIHADDAKKAWKLLRTGTRSHAPTIRQPHLRFVRLCKVVVARVLGRLKRARSDIVFRVGLDARSDPYHLHHFREKSLNRLLGTSRLSVVEKTVLGDGSIFLKVR